MSRIISIISAFLFLSTAVIAQSHDQNQYHWPNFKPKLSDDDSVNRFEIEEDQYEAVLKFLPNLRTQENTHLTDSTISLQYEYATNEILNGKKLVYTYNRNGFKTEMKEYQWNGMTDRWDPLTLEEYEYDGFGKQKLRLINHWDATNDRWITTAQEEHNFDTIGKIIWIYYNLDDDTGNLVPWYKNEYILDANGNIVEVYNFDVYVGNNKWIINGKVESTFDQHNNIVRHVSFTVDKSTGQLIPTSKTEYNYNLNGQRTSLEVAIWDKENDRWNIDLRMEYTYNNQGLTTNFIEYHPVEGFNGLMATYKIETYFDGNNRDTLTVYHSFDWQTGDLYQGRKRNTSYSANGNVSIEFTKDAPGGPWVEDEKNEKTVNQNDNTEVTITFSWDSNLEAWVNESKKEIKLDEYNYVIKRENFGWNGEVADWILRGSLYLYRSEHDVVTAIQEEDIHSIIYPNPFIDYIYLKKNNSNLRFDLFNVKGQVVISDKSVSQYGINLQALEPGVYIYQLSEDNQILRGKLLKR